MARRRASVRDRERREAVRSEPVNRNRNTFVVAAARERALRELDRIGDPVLYDARRRDVVPAPVRPPVGPLAAQAMPKGPRPVQRVVTEGALVLDDRRPKHCKKRPNGGLAAKGLVRRFVPWCSK